VLIEEEIRSKPLLTTADVSRITGALRHTYRRMYRHDGVILWAYTPEQFRALRPCINVHEPPVEDFKELERQLNAQMREGKLPSPTLLSRLMSKSRKDWFREFRRARDNIYLETNVPVVFEIGWWSMYGSTFIDARRNSFGIIVLARPRALQLDASCYLIHRTDGPAFLSANGQRSYVIHGELVPPELFEAPTKLSDRQIRKLIQINNVSARTAILEKLEPTSVLRAIRAEELDRWREYTLYTSPFTRYHMLAYFHLRAHCLTMRNPTTGQIHFEWVPIYCRTVSEALAFRNHRSGFPVVLT